jgi:hypothetical protein
MNKGVEKEVELTQVVVPGIVSCRLRKKAEAAP